MIEPSRCTGCGACAAVCSRDAIRMEADREGFLYPVIHKDRCVECGRCESVCPVGKVLGRSGDSDQAFLAMAKDTALCLQSSSGGVFSLLAEQIFRKGGIVFGCVMSGDGYSARHVGVESPGNLNRLRGSKYLQSDLEDTFRQTKAALVQGRYVLFTGTPCEIAGLKAYLTGVDTERLLAVDVLCHGVPSPDVWKRYLEELEEKYQFRAERVNFRNKSQGWQKYSLECTFQNGAIYRKSVLEEPYLRGFVENLILRPSCHNCGFKADQYHSDMTIGDFWGVKRLLPELGDAPGVSVVIVHTSKGEETMKSLQDCRIEPLEMKAALGSNPSYYAPATPNPWRDRAMEQIRRHGAEKTLKKYCSNTLTAKIRRKLGKMIRHF